jgi:hypothetical protein
MVKLKTPTDHTDCPKGIIAWASPNLPVRYNGEVPKISDPRKGSLFTMLPGFMEEFLP